MFSIGDKVQKITDGKVGTIKNIISGKYQVIFEDGSAPYLSEDILQPYQEILTPLDAFTKCKFSGITDYRRTLSFQRLSGELTNMFYSMNNSFTEYLPHQFLPVTKFLQSPEERILIADEVGLGKTVEAMYIWKELEARRNARRLLVVCPAALREKWKRDMENLFGINAEIVKADKLFDRFQLIEKNKNREQFAYICSMESIRAKNTDAIFTTVCKLNKAFEDFSANYSEYAFNLTIIDEAHYLRNRETANFKTGARLRDISESFVLLSATPIQTGSENLYSLLNLLSPERFDNEWTFNHMLQKDSIFIQLANCLQRPSSTPDDFEKTIIDNAENGNLKEDELIQEIVASKESIFSSNEARMSYATDLRNQIFYNNLFNRTRRRFVFENTAKRKPNAVQFSLSPNELDLYNQVTQLIRDMSTGRSEIVTFALIARQRQMASCLPAAFKDWLNKAQDNDSLSDNDFSDDLSEFDDADNSENETSTKNTFENLKPFYSKIKKEFSNINYQELKSHDSKYNEFLESIKTLLKQNPKEKIIVFSFFRGTNEYLEERLKEDNINAVAIKGGMGNLKDDLLDEFRQNDSINILISSEVGSEGLDLQFASVEYNYDLPWNPMRLEQRIGRIDRIGQKAEVLRIFNLCCQNTIEDKILERLYERVKIFENSIGDMEDIVGQPIQELAIEILNPELTDADRDEKANQKIQVLINKRIMNNRLEEESGVLEEYREMVLNSIEKAKENKRDIDSAEKIFVISDFFKNYYPGTAFFEDKNNSQHYLLTMSDEAVLAFREFRRTEHLEKFTRIDSSAHSEVYLSFAKESNQRKRRNIENVELDHPIFDWIRWTVKKNPIRANACSAINMKPSELVQTGSYIYYIQKWVKTGVEKSAELKYFVASVENRTILDENRSEKILNSAITEGSSLIDANIRLMDFEPYYNTAQELINHAWDKYEAFVENYKKKSNYLYKKQMEFINFTADKKIQTHQQTIENLEAENKGTRVIPMYQKMIEKIDSERNLKLKSLEKEQYLEPELFETAIGVLIVE